MNEQEFYEGILGLPEGWAVFAAEKDEEARKITIQVCCETAIHPCPSCGGETVLYGSTERTVRHLDICAYKTYLTIKAPRLRCPQCGVKSARVPFADKSMQCTTKFEDYVVSLCKDCGLTTDKAAQVTGIHFTAVHKIKNRAVERAKEAAAAKRPRKPMGGGNGPMTPPTGIAAEGRDGLRKVIRMAIDETSFGSHHDYLTIFTDAVSGYVIDVINGRNSEAVKWWFENQQIVDLSGLESVSMDMALPYIKAVRECFVNANELICFDRFHVAQLFSRAVDAVRRKESAALDRKHQENPMTGSRFEWLRNNRKTDNRCRRRRRFKPLTEMPLLTAKAWRLKELAAGMWQYSREGNAKKAWKRLLWRLSHSRIKELKTLYETLKKHLQGILNAIRLRATNAIAESRNSCIQRIKYRSCGFRNRERFRMEILFQFGGLDFSFQ